MRGNLLKKVELTEISSITLDSYSDSIKVELQLHVGHEGEVAVYEEEYTCSKDTPEYLTKAMYELALATQRMLNERLSHKGPVPCDTCTGACCHIVTGTVRLTEQDVIKLANEYGKQFIDERVTFYKTQSFTGFMAEMKMKDLEGFAEPTYGCVNSTPQGCSIYEHRPQICRDYSPWDNCNGQEGSLYKEDPLKLDGKLHLRVVRTMIEVNT